MKTRVSSVLVVALLFAVKASSAVASPPPTPTPTPTVSPTPQYSTGNFFKDPKKAKKAIRTAPFVAKTGDLKGVFPVGGITAALFATDRRTSGAVPTSANWANVSRDISYAGGGFAT